MQKQYRGIAGYTNIHTNTEMSYNATYDAMYGNGNIGGNIDTSSLFLFKQYNDLLVKNYTNLTFHDIYRYYMVLLWFGATCGITA